MKSGRAVSLFYETKYTSNELLEISIIFLLPFLTPALPGFCNAFLQNRKAEKGCSTFPVKQIILLIELVYLNC